MLFMHDPLNVWSYVYFIQVESGPIKIGSTDNIENRKNELQTANHEKLTVLHYTTGGRALEKHLHRKFSKHNKLGEWFWPAEEILQFINEIRLEDEVYGRVDSIVHFAINNGHDMQKDDWEILVDLTRGSILSPPQIEAKLFYWQILDSYEKYLENYPKRMGKKRRISLWRNEGNQSWDKEIKKTISG